MKIEKAQPDSIYSKMPPEELAFLKKWTEEFTGGPNKCQVSKGGTCIRPDIILHQKCCNNCISHPFCLCRSKVIK